MGITSKSTFLHFRGTDPEFEQAMQEQTMFYGPVQSDTTSLIPPDSPHPSLPHATHCRQVTWRRDGEVTHYIHLTRWYVGETVETEETETSGV